MSKTITAPFASDTVATTDSRRMWAVGAVAGVASSLVVIALAAIAEGADVPMEVAENSTKKPEQIPLLGYATVILGSTLVGLLLATALGRWTRRPRLTFVIVALGADGLVVRLPGNHNRDNGHQGDTRNHPRHPCRIDHPSDRLSAAVATSSRNHRLIALQRSSGARAT